MIAQKYGLGGLAMSIREFFLCFAKFKEDRDPKFAALLREVASHYPDVVCTYEFTRDKNGNVVFDYDDWDELSDNQRINRGNRLAAIAALDKLRFELELMSDEDEDKETVSSIRRGLAKLAPDW